MLAKVSETASLRWVADRESPKLPFQGVLTSSGILLLISH